VSIYQVTNGSSSEHDHAGAKGEGKDSETKDIILVLTAARTLPLGPSTSIKFDKTNGTVAIKRTITPLM
jgi:hypothetical protein